MAKGPRKTRFYAEAALNLRTTEALFFVNEALFDAMQEVLGFETVANAKALAPVLAEETKERKPGELRDSIDAKVRKVSGKKTGVRASVFTTCGYGGWVELGTVHSTKQPFIWPAFEQNSQRILEALAENLQNFTGSGNPLEEEEG